MSSKRESTLKFHEAIQGVVREMRAHWPLTLRQVYYRLVAAEHIPNNLRSYKRLSRHLGELRIRGLVPWAALEDRVRRHHAVLSWLDADDFIEDEREQLLRGFRRDLLQGQPLAVEVWLEKDALSSIVRAVAQRYHVPVNVAVGFASKSFCRNLAERAKTRHRQTGQETMLVHFSDFDPSGQAMLPSLLGKLREDHRCEVVFGRHYALTLELVHRYNLPHDPSALKKQDSRAARHVARYGEIAVELDALHPETLQQIVAAAIEENLDMSLFEEQRRLQALDLMRVEGERRRITRLMGGTT